MKRIALISLVAVVFVGCQDSILPTDPVFAARSELYEHPFIEYAVPQAVLRFRQGFGRLIRSREDRGAVVVLDGRIHSKAYGKWFLESVPPATSHRGPMAGVVAEVRRWLDRPDGEAVEA